jgi:hypothetical protein
MEKVMYLFPGIADYFLAGVANGAFINDFLSFYIKLILADSQTRNQIVKIHNLQIGSMSPGNNFHLYSIASHLAIQSKQA